MKIKDIIVESSNMASAEQIWDYVGGIHPKDQQGGGFLKRLIMRNPQYELKRVPLSSLHVPNDEDDGNDPYGRAMFVDVDHAREYSQHHVDKKPVVADAEGHILDGAHRAWAAAELLNRTDIMAWVPAEKLTEIERMSGNEYTGGKKSLRIGAGDKNIKKLPGTNAFMYSTEDNHMENGIIIKLWDSANIAPKPVQMRDEDGEEFAWRLRDWERNQSEDGPGTLIGKLVLEDVPYFPLKGALQVDAITVDEDYRGQGVAKSLYGIALSILRRPLLAGRSQTPGGRRNWASLSSIPGVDVKGYIAINESRFANPDSNRDIDTIMGRLGGQYIGPSRPFGIHYFAFDVVPGSGELAPAVKTKMSQIYDGDSSPTGLYAVWSGSVNEQDSLKQTIKEGQSVKQEIKDFIDSLTPADVGVEEFPGYRIHFEGFTDDCKLSSDYQRNPNKVYQQVYQDFVQREGGQKPAKSGMTGDEEYPILYSVFRVPQSKTVDTAERAYSIAYRKKQPWPRGSREEKLIRSDWQLSGLYDQYVLKQGVAEERLDELFQHGKQNWTWKYKADTEAIAKFTVGDRDYVWQAFNHFRDDKPHKWEIQFRVVRQSTDPEKLQVYGTTGTGNSAEVMSIAVDIMREFLQYYGDSVQQIAFDAKENSRIALYRKMVQRLLPNWNADEDYNPEYGLRFTLTRPKSVAENFADGRNPGRKGLAKRSGVNTKASVSSLRKTAKNSSGEKQRMAHWLANMKAGCAKAKK